MELVRSEPLSSQHGIRDRLSAIGYEATQSTISRDLEELGLVRVRDASGALRYARPNEAAASGRTARVRTLLAEFVTSFDASGNLVVVKTTPGAANALAEALDRSGMEGVLGTVAGDDTVLLVASEGTRGRVLVKRLREMAASP